ncbi:uncharacterized protein CIMG_12824 [Coccidioides immitis RS]|uniref:Uncharacterized protein n=1 Tax=Coccidioides immitis (strain RS) TaxID=246410 RepID=A0A0D8JSJ4_COCIM|nr:uncharacterized protein CIMG_12824 [Coccidioides immitis RS]KJF60252.1 hypothetical protein CIMG_12824 [Coccidioides immitis RS]
MNIRKLDSAYFQVDKVFLVRGLAMLKVFEEVEQFACYGVQIPVFANPVSIVKHGDMPAWTHEILMSVVGIKAADVDSCARKSRSKARKIWRERVLFLVHIL